MTDVPEVLEFTADGFKATGPLTLTKLRPWLWRLASIRVLVVVDTEISIDEDPIAFGVGRFIRLLRESTVGCTGFSVDVGIRTGGPFVDNGAVADGDARYLGFRFDSVVGGEPVLAGYDETFLFGFKPDNSGGPDTNIDQPSAFPTSDAELAALSTWMNNGGGVFATGDHDYLGASMCHRIPRVGTMRKWTNAQGVPPIGGRTRLDTHQPTTPAERAGTAMISAFAQTDAVPQPIDWVAERVQWKGIIEYRTPHELLCHPSLGPIDVMPDHAHEGCCIETLAAPDAVMDFGAGAFDEYPSNGGSRELPSIIAYGRVVPDPPHIHQKGDVDPFRIAMISAYDGHAVGIGRVVTDSTWHHWFDLNIAELESAKGTTDHWSKISRYFVNVAKWIARPGRYRALCWWEVLFAHYSHPGVEEFGWHGRLDLAQRLEIGSAFREYLVRGHGACTVSRIVLDSICDIHPVLCGLIEERIFPKFPGPGPCLSCPSWDVIERVVLSGFVEGTRDLAHQVRVAVDVGDGDLRLRADEIRAAAFGGAERALLELSRDVAASASDVAVVFGRDAGAAAD